MTRFPTGRIPIIACTGLLLGLGVLIASGPHPAGDSRFRVIVDADRIDEVRSDLEETLGTPPSPERLRIAVEADVRREILQHEAVRRDYIPSNDTVEREPWRYMEAIGRARLAGSGPTEEEARAFHALRAERYTDAAGAPMGWPDAREPVLEELRAEARAAADRQFFQELASRYRIVLRGPARELMRGGFHADEGAAAHAAESAETGGDPGGDPLALAVLDVVEVEDGVWDLRLTHTARDARFDSVRLASPEACETLEEPGGPVVGPPDSDAPPGGASRTLRWTLDCPFTSLHGADLTLQRLSGTDLLVHAEVRALDGRSYTALTGSAPPRVSIPDAPGWRSTAAVPAARTFIATLGQLELWVLLFVAAAVPALAGGLPAGALGFGVGYFGANWFASGAGPLLAAYLAVAYILLTALAPALDLVRRRPQVRSWLQPPWLGFGLVGIVLGATSTVLDSGGWISASEWTAMMGAGAIGATGAFLGAGGLMLGIWRLTRSGSGSKIPSELMGVVGVVAAVALLVPSAAAAIQALPPELPRITLELAAFSLILGLALPVLDIRPGPLPVLMFGTLLLLGVAAGVPETGRTLAGLATLGPLFAVGMALLVGGRLPNAVVLGAAAAAAVAFGWRLRLVAETGATSFPPALAVGTGIMAIAATHAGSALSSGLGPAVRRRAGILLGGAAVLAAVLWRLGDYQAWLVEEVVPVIAAGRVPIPVVAIALLAAAVLARPRKRRIPEALGIRTPARRTHWILTCAAFFLLPVGTITAAPPGSGAGTTEGSDLTPVVTDLLRSTYTAFNLDDEEALYDRLSETVTEELVADLYLDSRRRLRAGTLEGDEVTIRGVEVVHAGTPHVTGTGSGGGERTAEVTVEARWVVTSRIRHLQHTHDRRNIYDGLLRLQRGDGRWRISDVELLGEDRVVIPWAPD